MDLQSCSLKVNERAQGPKFIGNEQECDAILSESDHFLCHFHFPNSHDEITIYGRLTAVDGNKVIKEARFFTNVKGPALAFLDALIELAHQRDHKSLLQLRLKEIEFFLRDNNSTPSFPDDGVELYRYYEVMQGLKSAISRSVPDSGGGEVEDDRRSPTLDEYNPHSLLLFDRIQLGEFLTLNTALKVQLVNEVLKAHVRPLLRRDAGDIDCLHVMENVVVVLFKGNCGNCDKSLTTTMDFIKKVLRIEFYESSIDVISDT